jgi:hypothetical protein
MTDHQKKQYEDNLKEGIKPVSFRLSEDARNNFMKILVKYRVNKKMSRDEAMSQLLKRAASRIK